MRTVQIMGRLAADAEKKISKSGKEFISFRVGNNEFSDEKDESGKQKTYWFNVTCFNQRHFGLAKYLTKGKPVIIDGDYSDRIYQNRDGKCEIARDILANSIYFFPSTGDGTAKPQAATQSGTIPSIQTKMEQPKPTTAEIKVPDPVAVNDSDDDDLPF